MHKNAAELRAAAIASSQRLKQNMSDQRIRITLLKQRTPIHSTNVAPRRTVKRVSSSVNSVESEKVLSIAKEKEDGEISEDELQYTHTQDDPASPELDQVNCLHIFFCCCFVLFLHQILFILAI